MSWIPLIPTTMTLSCGHLRRRAQNHACLGGRRSTIVAYVRRRGCVMWARSCHNHIRSNVIVSALKKTLSVSLTTDVTQQRISVCWCQARRHSHPNLYAPGTNPFGTSGRSLDGYLTHPVRVGSSSTRVLNTSVLALADMGSSGGVRWWWPQRCCVG